MGKDPRRAFVFLDYRGDEKDRANGGKEYFKPLSADAHG